MCFERDLDRGVQDIALAVARRERELMIADANAPTSALRRDVIDPGDFLPLPVSTAMRGRDLDR